MSAVSQRLVKNGIMDATLFRDIVNTTFDFLEKLNISNSNDSSLTLDTFSLVTISFCRIPFSARFIS